MRKPDRRPQENVAVVIPIYKSSLTSDEEISLHRCRDTLGKYKSIIIAPDNLDLTEISHDLGAMDVCRFDPEHFRSVQAYDRMMLSKNFYRRFLDYEYILIHQLDAFIFSDSLDEWCLKGYDYVGAPWIDLPKIDLIAASCTRLRRLFPERRKKWNCAVGNGGLSLRKVRSFLRFLSVWENKANTWPYYEDTFWAFFATDYPPFFRVPKFEEALKFAFEFSPAKCYELNNRQLPFGCHAWEKYDLGFWRPIFYQLGYAI
jgi:hypothetical protein